MSTPVIDVAQTVPTDDLRNVPQLVRRRATEHPDAVAFSVHRGEATVDVTGAEFLADVESLAKGLIAHGLQPGDHVAVMSATRYEWTVCDFAILFAGGVVVPVYETNTVGQTAFVLQDSGAVAAFAEGGRHVKVVTEAAAQAGVELSAIWRMHGSSDLDDLRALGAGVSDEDLLARSDLATPDTIASLVYTSGTTAEPRGAAITHRNLAHLAVNVIETLQDILFEGASTVLLLPLAHILARFVQLGAYVSGTRITHVRDASRVIPILAAARPTMMVVVPRVMAKVLAGVRKSATEKKLGKAFDRAEHAAIEWGRHLEAVQEGRKGRTPLSLRLRHALFDKLFYARIRSTLGGNLGTLVSGAAPLDQQLAYFFRGVGIEVLEGYGLTETTAPITVNRPGASVIGGVGTLVPGSTLKIAEDDEILVKGIGVFAGYHHGDGDEFDADGFFRTGDLGRVDHHGRLFITGRAKDMIITDSGKNVSPQKWQGVLERDALVANAVVIGDRRPHLAALLVIDPAGVADWASANNRPDLATRWAKPGELPGEKITDPQLLTALEHLVDRANAQVSNAERVRHWVAVAADVSEDAGYVTPTMKLKRQKFLDAMSPVIEQIYS
ncbi:AMP-dependent synthetase/ligase [Aestuariimicrobium kwangyangense]|uniref:AMP-dependent synthetase/ligase n=1 Tax=Aestuariimicrobium kwangyangense TaxID=396389 RepID=UPI000411476A|nr:AMP-binding protein [Aestuariimicrobium kwangyangense]